MAIRADRALIDAAPPPPPQELERSEMDGSVAPAELAAEASRLIEKYVRPGCDYEVSERTQARARPRLSATGKEPVTSRGGRRARGLAG